MNNKQTIAALLLRAAECTDRDELREELVDAAIALTGCMVKSDSVVINNCGATLEDVMDRVLASLSTGPKTVKELDDELLRSGASRVTLQRAKAELNKKKRIHEFSEGFGEDHVWYVESRIYKDR